MIRFIMYAAGISSRMETFAPNGIKGLIDIEGTRLMQYQLNWMASYKPDSIVIVLGLEHEEIKNHVGDKYNGVEITYVYNHDYKTKGNMLSLWAAREYCNCDVLFTTSDLLCHPNDIDIFMNANYDNKILIDNSSSLFSDPDPVKVSIQNGRIVQVLKEIDAHHVSGIAIGVYKFSESAISNLLGSIKSDIEVNDDNKSLYYSVDSILHTHTVMPVCCEKKEWFDVDTPGELQVVKEYMLRHEKEYTSKL